MDRRDFLLFRTRQNRRELSLSGEWLYMKWLDATAEASPALPFDASQHAEPPTVFARYTVSDLFDDLNRRLRAVDVVRVSKLQMVKGELRRELNSALRTFRARGGRVEFET